MSIRKRSYLKRGTDKVLGHVDFGGTIGSGDKTGDLASVALVDAQLQASLIR